MAGKPVLAIAETLVLRRLSPSDLSAFQTYRQDPVVARFQSWERMNDAEALDFLRHMATCQLLRPGHWSQIAIAQRKGDALIGDIGIFLSPDQTEVELGITLARPHQGQGHATTAMQLACSQVFERSAVRRIVAGCDQRNTPSCALLARVGFTKTGTKDVDGVTEMNFQISRPASEQPIK